MSTGQYTHVTRNAGEIVSADLYNGAHQNQKQNDVPTSCGAHADDLTMFQATTDPAPGGVATPVAALGDELEQLRFVLAEIKTVLNDGVPPAEWYTPVTFDATLFQARGARVSRAATQAIAQNTLTAISFSSATWDTGVIAPAFDPFFSGAQPTRLTARATGVYQINGNVEWAAVLGSNSLRVAIRVNGTTNIAATAQGIINSGTRFEEVGTQIVLNENDYVELVVYQNATASLNISAGAQFSLELLSLTAAIAPPPEAFAQMNVVEGGTSFSSAQRFLTVTTQGLITTAAADATLTIPTGMAMTLRGMCVKMTTAVTASNTVRARFIVNGTVDSTIDVNLVSGDTTITALGAIALVPGDTLAIQIDPTGGAAKTIAYVSIAYTVDILTSLFVTFCNSVRTNRGQHAIFTSRAASTGGSGDSGVSTGGQNWIPLATTLVTVARQAPLALVAGSTVSYRYKIDTNSPISAVQDIVAPAQRTEATISAALPAFDPTSALTIAATLNNINEWISTAPAPGAGQAFYAHVYQVDASPTTQWFAQGSDTSAQTFGASSCFAAIGDELFDSTSTVQARRQIRWLTAGTFQFVSIAWAGLTLNDTLQLTLQVNGLDTAMTYTLTGAGATRVGLVDSALAVSVSANDDVNWRLIRTSGTDTSATIQITVGFTPA